MNKGLFALTLVAVAMLIVAGCASKTEAPATPATGEDKTVIGQEATTSGAAAEEQSITGDLNQVDSMNSELVDPELDKTGDYIDEVNW